MKKIIFIGNDHAGSILKVSLASSLEGYEIYNCGTDEETSVDYPDFAKLVTEKVANNSDSIGILICGSGIGMSIAANRNPQIRAALCHNQEYAELARQHNDANVLVLGGRFLSLEKAKNITYTFLNTCFLGGRHLQRIEKLSNISQLNDKSS